MALATLNNSPLAVTNGGTGTTAATHTHALKPKGGRRFWVGDSGGKVRYGEARRIPTIDRKLMELQEAGEKKPYGMFVHGDVAIGVLGFYNPMYAGRPKKIVQMMLNAFINPVRHDNALVWSGLGYSYPELIGIRSARCRLSAAGIDLLDHWAKTFPKFAAFLAPYDKLKNRQQIISECYDLSIGHRPLSFRKIDEANKLNQLKADSRELKRIKKEEQYRLEQEKKRHQHEEMMRMQALMQQQSMLGKTTAYPQGVYWGSTTNNTAADNPSYLAAQKKYLKGLFGS